MQYFPQPSVPYAIYERTHSFTVQDDSYLEEDCIQNEVDGHIIGAFMECLEEIDIKSKELFKKIISNGHVEIPLGKLARDAIGDSRAKDFLEKIVTKVGNKMKAKKDEGLVVTKRDIVSNDDELSLKLERFKVKTINIGGVVKQDQN